MQGIAFGSSPYRFPWFGAPFKKKSTSQEDSYMKSLAGFSHVSTNKSSGFSFAMRVCNRIYSILSELPSPNPAANAPENRPKLPQRERIEKFQPSIFRCYVAIQTWISREFHHSILSQDPSDPKRSHVSNLGESVSRPKRDLKSMKTPFSADFGKYPWISIRSDQIYHIILNKGNIHMISPWHHIADFKSS